MAQEAVPVPELPVVLALARLLQRERAWMAFLPQEESKRRED